VEVRVPELCGAVLKVLKDAAPESASLEMRRDAHAFDLGAVRAGAAQGADCGEFVVQQTDDEVAALLEVDAADRVEVVVPGARPGMRSGVVERILMQRPHSVVVGVLEATDP